MALLRATVVANNGGNTSSTVVNFPTAASHGAAMLIEEQFMLLIVEALSGNVGTITPPSGWSSALYDFPTATNNGNGSGTFWVFYKRARQVDVINGSVSIASSYSNDFVTAYLLTFDDVPLVSPFAGLKIAAGGSSSQKFVNPGQVTPTGAGCLAIIASINSNGATVLAAGIPAGYTEAGHFYPSNNYHQSFVAVANAQTTDASPAGAYLTWDGQYSQFAICSLTIVLGSVLAEAVVLQSTEYARAAAAWLDSNVEDSVSSPAFAAITYRNWLRAMHAIFVGRTSGASSASPVFSDVSGTKQRLTCVLDGSNNRSSISPSLT